MTDAGFFKGTSTDQDSRFADKKKKLMKSMKFGDNLNQKVDTQRVNVECIKPWIVKRITELLSYDDDIVCDFVVNLLSEQFPDPKDIQINLTAFLGSKSARIFVTELWDLLLSAMNTPGGVPAIFLEAKKAELLSSRTDEEKFRNEISRSSGGAPTSTGSRPAIEVKKEGDGSATKHRSPLRLEEEGRRSGRRERRRYSMSDYHASSLLLPSANTLALAPPIESVAHPLELVDADDGETDGMTTGPGEGDITGATRDRRQRAATTTVVTTVHAVVVTTRMVLMASGSVRMTSTIAGVARGTAVMSVGSRMKGLFAVLFPPDDF
ncbi:unnamed protein product [Mesocestoides corti]|uniref:PWI domain-containing protein n=1 Tax=Mesocestoides corti TaxID=53468 RepID=A0A0R3UJ52_MESCO|nr:unnamed protein product [Mesocestoides corti]